MGWGTQREKHIGTMLLLTIVVQSAGGDVSLDVLNVKSKHNEIDVVHSGGGEDSV